MAKSFIRSEAQSTQAQILLVSESLILKSRNLEKAQCCWPAPNPAELKQTEYRGLESSVSMLIVGLTGDDSPLRNL